MNQKHAEPVSLMARLGQALSGEEFLLYHQAIIPLSVKDKRPFEEILIRFQEEERKLLWPGTFLPPLEQHGLMPLVDRWVLSRICRWVRTARSVRPDWPVPRYGINLSPHSLKAKSFPTFVKHLLKAAELPPGTFCFELLWPDAIEHAEVVVQLVQQLRPAGCLLTIARFEAVPRSFELLRVLAPDFVKISPSVVTTMAHNRASAETVEAIHRECCANGMHSIAECVESTEILELLLGIGIHYAQGYAIATPKPLS